MTLEEIEESLGLGGENIIHPSLIVLEKKGILTAEDKLYKINFNFTSKIKKINCIFRLTVQKKEINQEDLDYQRSY